MLPVLILNCISSIAEVVLKYPALNTVVATSFAADVCDLPI